MPSYIKPLFIFLTFHISFISVVYSQGKISGRVLDEQSRPLKNIIISLATDSLDIKLGNTNENGFFSFDKLPIGTYRIMIIITGYEKFTTGFFTLTKDKIFRDFGNIEIKSAPIELQNVEVIGKKNLVERKDGKLILNIENSIIATGNSAYEILTKAPGVSIDKDGHISLNGKNGASIMIDGKLTYLSDEQLVNLLKTMNSSTIHAMEIMSNPSAKYDAAGTAGIINIKTKKNENFGSNGDLIVSGGYGDFYKSNIGLNFNYRNNKLNFFSYYTYGKDKEQEKLTISRANNDGVINTLFNQVGKDTNWIDKQTYKAGIDYDINDHTVLGFIVNGSKNDTKGNSNNSTLIGSKPFVIDSIISGVNSMNSTYQNQTYNLNFKSDIDTLGQELTADIDYSRFFNTNKNTYNNEFALANGSQLKSPIIYRSATPALINIWVAKIDYRVPFSDDTKMEVGAKTSLVKTNNDLQFEIFDHNIWKNDQSKSNRFIYEENINAAYGTISHEFDATTLSFGLRVEHTNAKGNSITSKVLTNRNYIDFFPNLAINQTLTDYQELDFSYSRRIDRPDYQSLNPFLYFADLYTYSKGNPLLKPEYTNTFELSYTYNDKYVATLGYSKTKDVITTTLITDQTLKTLFITEQNLAEEYNFNLDLSIPINLTKWWSTTNDVNLNYDRYNSPDLSGIPFKSGKLAYTVNTTQTFNLNATLAAELSGNYQSSQIEGTYIAKPIYGIDLGISKSFSNQKAKLKLAINDLFNTQNIDIKSTIASQDYHLIQKEESRIFRLSFSYNFGNKALKTVRERTNGASEEQRRVKQ